MVEDSKWIPYVAVVLFILLFVITFRLYFASHKSEKYSPVRFMSRVAIFGAMAAILYVVDVFTIKLPFFPSFLSLHFDEIPAFICGFAYGPLSALAVIAIKTVIKLPFTTTMGIGEACDLVLSMAYVVIACAIYKKIRNLKGVAIAFGVSTVAQVIIAMILNVVVMVPFYMFLFNMTEESLLKIMQLAIPAISDIKWSYALFAVLPFNLLKDAVVMIVTFIVYRSLHVFLRMKREA